MDDRAAKKRQIATQIEYSGRFRREHGVINRMGVAILKHRGLRIYDAVDEAAQLMQQLRVEAGPRLRVHRSPVHAKFGVETGLDLIELCRLEIADVSDSIHGSTPSGQGGLLAKNRRVDDKICKFRTQRTQVTVIAGCHPVSQQLFVMVSQQDSNIALSITPVHHNLA